MKFKHGEGQKIGSIDLDRLYDDIKRVMQRHKAETVVTELNDLIAEWINDLLFMAGLLEPGEDDISKVVAEKLEEGEEEE